MRRSLALFTAVSLAIGGFGVVGCHHDRDHDDGDIADQPHYDRAAARRQADTASPGSPSGDAMGRFPSGSPSNTGGQVPTETPGISPRAGVAVPNIVGGPSAAPAVVVPSQPGTVVTPPGSGPVVVPDRPSATVPPVTPGTGERVVPAQPAPAPGPAGVGPGAAGDNTGPGTVAPSGVGVTGSGTGIGSGGGTGTGASTPGGPDIGGRDRATDGVIRRSSTGGGGSAGGTSSGTVTGGAGNTGTTGGTTGGGTGGTTGGTTGGGTR